MAAPVPPFDPIAPAGRLQDRRRIDPRIDLGPPDIVDRFDLLAKVDIDAIEYDSGGVRVEGFVVVGKGSGPAPAVIYARGGGGQRRARIGPMILAKHLAPLALAGFTVIGTQYRTAPDGRDEFGGVDVADVVHLRSVVDELDEVQGSRVGLLGWSRGAMMVHLALAHAPGAFAAGVAAAGAADQATLLQRRPAMEAVFSDQIPEFERTREVALARRSPLRWAERVGTDTPILLLHGAEDTRVAASQSIALAGRFQELGVPYRLLVFDGARHGIFEHAEEVQTQISRWFRRHLA